MKWSHIPTYQEALDLVNKYECFVKKTEDAGGIPVTSFTYRLAGYVEFCEPGALNMRGITYNAETEDVIALPFWKFFNYGENPFTEINQVNEWDITSIYDKLDGSLVYFYDTPDGIQAKTKFNCKAPQSQSALAMVKEHPDWEDFIQDRLNNGFTPMFEYVGPDNRIVVPYEKSSLVFLGSRSMNSGNFFSHMSCIDDLPDGIDWPYDHVLDMDFNVQNVVDYCVNSQKMEEGFVVHFKNDEMVKFKTQKYRDLHHTLSSITNEKNLASIILDDQLDDIIPMLPIEYHEYVEEFRVKIVTNYNKIIHSVMEFFENNQEKSQKEYALAAIDQLGRGTYAFSTAMSLKNGVFDEATLRQRYIANQSWNA